MKSLFLIPNLFSDLSYHVQFNYLRVMRVFMVLRVLSVYITYIGIYF